MLFPKKILVVDEDHTALFLARLAVKRLAGERQVQMASNAQEALKIVRTDCVQEQCPHLIFFAIQSQYQDSFAFLEEFQNAPDLKQLPVQVVLVSSSRHYLQVARAKKYRVLAYLEKPLTPDKIARFLG